MAVNLFEETPFDFLVIMKWLTCFLEKTDLVIKTRAAGLPSTFSPDVRVKVVSSNTALI